LFDRAIKTEVASEKLRMLKALTKSKDIKILKFFLSQVDNENVVKKQDSPSIINSIALNSYGTTLVFDYMDKNWDSLLKKYLFHTKLKKVFNAKFLFKLVKIWKCIVHIIKHG
jgi:hypothetical protein